MMINNKFNKYKIVAENHRPGNKKSIKKTKNIKKTKEISI